MSQFNPKGWECGNCGTFNDTDNNICENCGWDSDGFPPGEEELEDVEDE